MEETGPDMKTYEVKIKYKWQQHMIDEIDELSFDEALERAIFVATLGDHMDHRDDWELKYLMIYLKELYDNAKPEWWKEMNPTYECPECGRLGFPSIFGPRCTACSNKKRFGVVC